MTIADLLHSLTMAGLSLRAGSSGAIEVVGAVHLLTLEQQQSLRKHKTALLAMLTPPTTCYLPEQDDCTAEAEREAIQWAESGSPDVLPRLLETIEYFEKLADDMQRHNPEALAQIVLEPLPQETPCRRCGSRTTYLAIIHAGESLRRDCAKCGRTLDFPSWHNRELSGQILADAIDESRYNAKADCSSAGNTQATLTPSP